MPKRWLTWIALAYCLAVVYASWMPYDFHGDVALARERLDESLAAGLRGPTGRVSLSDLAANVLLYVPLGLLCAGRVMLSRGVLRLTAVPVAGLLAAAVSLGVEAGQLMISGRVTSLGDLAANAFGGACGGLAAAIIGRSGWRAIGEAIRRAWTHRPALAGAGALAALLVLRELYPYHLTVDVSSIWANVKASAWSLSDGAGRHAWHYWMVKYVGTCAVLAGLLAAAGRGRGAALRGALGAVVLAALLEAGRLGIVGGSANLARWVFSSVGAGIGGLLYAAGRGRAGLSAALAAMCAAILAYLIYMEWGSLQFHWPDGGVGGDDGSAFRWLPLGSYAMGGRLKDLANFLGIILVSAALGLVGRARRDAAGLGGGWLRFAAWGAALGLVLETGQMLLPGRYASLTDVLCFAAGAGFGAALAGIRHRHVQEMDAADAPEAEVVPSIPPNETARPTA